MRVEKTIVQKNQMAKFWLDGNVRTAKIFRYVNNEKLSGRCDSALYFWYF